MIGQFERGQKFRANQEVAIFETQSQENQTGLFITQGQIWEIDGYDEGTEVYIMICRQAGIALKMTLEDINTLFNEVTD